MILSKIQSLTGLAEAQIYSLLSYFTILLFLYLLKVAIMRIVWKNTNDPEKRYKGRKTINTVYYIFIILIFFAIISQSGEKITEIFGFLTLGISFALQDIVKCFAGWVYIVWKNPFSIGDRVEIGDLKGDVIDIHFFRFSLMEIGNWVDADQSTGRVMHLPNSIILNSPIANFGQGFKFIWNEIPVLLTFESDWKTAKKILLDVANKNSEHISAKAEKYVRESSKNFMIMYKNLTPTVYTSVKDSGVMLTIRYLSNPQKRRTSEEEIWEEILIRFAEYADIDFAYPTQRFFNNKLECKEFVQ